MASTFRGLLGEKLGMTQVFDENNRLVPVTVVKAGPCVVTQVRTPEVDGYSAVQLGFGEIDPRKVNKPEGGHFTKAGVTPRRHLVELRTEDAGDYTVGQELTADVFDGVAKVDVIGTSKGKGTAGVMKRHGFKGLGAGARHAAQAPVARFHRWRVDPRSRVQGPEDGRPHGPREDDDAVAGRPQGRHGARAAADQGRRSRPEGWPPPRPLRGQGRPRGE